MQSNFLKRPITAKAKWICAIAAVVMASLQLASVILTAIPNAIVTHVA